LEPPADEGDDRGTVFGTDPAVHTVQRDDVELGQRCVVRPLRKVRFAERDVLQTGSLGKAARIRDVRWIEVSRKNFRSRIGRRNGVRRKALAASQIAITKRLAEAPR